MTRRRALRVGLAVAVLALAGLVAALSSGDGDPDRPALGAVAIAYAGTWDATCAALRSDADRTTTAVRARLGRSDSRASRRRIGRTVVAAYLGRTERRLSRMAGARPPAEWAAYHRTAQVRLEQARARTATVRIRVRAGDLAALGSLAPATATAGPAAPEELRRRTPACGASQGT